MRSLEPSVEREPLVYQNHEANHIRQLITRRPKPRRLIASIISIVLTCLILGIVARKAISSLAHHDIKPHGTCGHLAVRREWRMLSEKEKMDYLNATLCLRESPSRLSMNHSLYDDFPWVHALVGGYSHDAAPFLAWHRYFLHVYERSLRQECHYEGHLIYWDWTLDWENITKSAIWDPSKGFGGNGNASLKNPFLDGYCLTEGPFSMLEAPYIGAEYKPHCLSRGFESGENLAKLGQILKPEAVDRVLSLPDYDTFNIGLENGPHLAIPKIIAGDFQYFSAPNDPAFFLHHTQIDRLWWMWQHTDPRRRMREYLGKARHNSTEIATIEDVIPMGGLAVDVRVTDILDTQTGMLCYRY